MSTVGLTNLGNTCFINVCIQLLYAIPELAYIQNNNNNSLLHALQKFNAFLSEQRRRQTKQISPDWFVRIVKSVANQKHADFASYGQADMTEFFAFLLDEFHMSLVRPYSMDPPDINTLHPLAKSCFEFVKQDYSKDYSEIKELFYGIIVSEIRTPTHTRFLPPEMFGSLHVEIKGSIYDCLDDFFSDERIEGENALLNETTGIKEDIIKGTCVWNFPKILIISIQRVHNSSRNKNDTAIHYPIDGLDLQKYVSGFSPEKYVYDLFGVCLHHGQVNYGHYTAFVRLQQDWYHYNDHLVTPVKNINDIVSPYAYSLFYRRK